LVIKEEWWLYYRYIYTDDEDVRRGNLCWRRRGGG
jgi:hypothetical protein